MTFKLYHYPISPFCRKLRLVLSEKNVDFELVEERYWENSQEFKSLNLAGKVPVLWTSEGIFPDSQATCEYIDEIYPEPPMFPETALEKFETRRLISWFDEKFHEEVTSNLVGERLLRRVKNSSGYPDEGKIMFGFKCLKFHLEYMKILLERRNWLAGEVRTLADFAAASHISCLDFAECIKWNDHEVIKDWYARLKSRPSFQPLLSEYLPDAVQPPPWYSDLDF